MIDTNRVPRSYRVTETNKTLPPLGRERSWHETRLSLTRLCTATFDIWSNFYQLAAISLFRAFFG